MTFEMFLDLTPKEFFKALREKEKHEEGLVTAQVRTICETIRLQTAHLLNVQLPRGKRIKNIKHLMRFQWDQKFVPAQTKEEMKALMKAIAKGVTTKKKEDANRKRRNR